MAEDDKDAREISAWTRQSGSKVVWQTVTEDILKMIAPLIQGLGSASVDWFESGTSPQKRTARDLVLMPMIRLINEEMQEALRSIQQKLVPTPNLSQIQASLTAVNERFAEITEPIMEDARRHLQTINKQIAESLGDFRTGLKIDLSDWKN